MSNLTWTCHVCGIERDDKDITVAIRTGITKQGAVMRRNVRHCIDDPECISQAMMAAHNHVKQFGEPLNPCACGSGRQQLLTHFGTEPDRYTFQCEDCLRKGLDCRDKERALRAWNNLMPYNVRSFETSAQTQHAR